MDFMNAKDIIDKTSRMMASMTKAETEFKLDFVPVIFGNGEDNDCPGLLAAIGNERVQYEDTIYKPNESIVFDRTFFGLVNSFLLNDVNTGLIYNLANVIRCKPLFYLNNGSRTLTFKNCTYSIIVTPRM